jgi:hypothetical protein
MEVFSDNTIKLGTYNQEAIIISGSRAGMGTALPQAELHISGANNDSLFRIQSPASSSIIFVSGSGNVGIGTLTPTQKVSVDNGNVGFTSGFGLSWDSNTEWIRRATGSDQLQFATQDTVRLNIGSTQGQLVTIGLGATTGTAQFQVRGGGATSATTAMRIENSGGTARLTILDDGTSAFNTSHLYISSSGIIGVGTATPTIGILDINGVARVRSTNQLYFGGTGASDWQGAISGQSSGLLVNLNVLTINNSGYASPATQSFAINTSQNVAIGPHTPTARLHVSGASNSGLFEIDSPAVNNIIYVSGSGNVGIGIGTPAFRLDVSGSAKFGTGSVGFASGLGQVHAVDRTGAYISATQTSSSIVTFMGADSNGGIIGTYSNHNLLIRTNNSNKITVEPNNIGIQTTPTQWIHLSSDPSSNKWIQIDATQVSASPTEQNGTPDTAIGQSGNTSKYLTEPDYWIEIKLGAAGGDIVLIPCYIKGV